MFIGLDAMTQIDFEKGYFIDKNNQRIECLIKNESWDVNTGTFTYRSSTDTNVKIKKFQDIEEISIYNIIKYKRFDVKIDVNVTNEFRNMSFDRTVKLEDASLLLKVLLEGNNSLFSHKADNFTYFFYTSPNTIIPEQLIYKQYLSNDINRIKDYNAYLQLLAKEFICVGISQTIYERTSYNEGDLIRFFKRYNDCKGYSYSTYSGIKDRKRFYFKLKSGISLNNFNFEDVKEDSFDHGYSQDFDSKILPVIGIEIEYFLPVKGNKWSVYFDPRFRSYSSSKPFQSTPNLIEMVDVNFKSIELPFNVRYYIYLKNKSKFSISGGIIFDSAFGSSIEFENPGRERFTEINPKYAFIVGASYHMSKFEFELRYNSRNIINNSGLYNSTYQNFDFMVSYILF